MAITRPPKKKAPPPSPSASEAGTPPPSKAGPLSPLEAGSPAPPKDGSTSPVESIAESELIRPEDITGPFVRFARTFLHEQTMENEKDPRWNACSSDKMQLWQGDTMMKRCITNPGLFTYWEQRSTGRLPSPGLNTFPRCRGQIDEDMDNIENSNKFPKGGEDWKETQWNKGSTGDGISRDMSGDCSPSHVATTEASGTKSSGTTWWESWAAASMAGQLKRLPKATKTTPPERVLMGKLGCLPSGVEGLSDDLTEIPPGYRLHPNRQWTRSDREELYDLAEEGYSDEEMCDILQRGQEQWREYYQWWANLYVHNPRIGGWTAELDTMLEKFIEVYNVKNWDRMAFHLGTTVEEARRYWASCFQEGDSPDNDESPSDRANKVDTEGTGTSPEGQSEGHSEEAKTPERSPSPKRTLEDTDPQESESESEQPKSKRTCSRTPSHSPTPERSPSPKRTLEDADPQESESESEQPKPKRRCFRTPSYSPPRETPEPQPARARSAPALQGRSTTAEGAESESEGPEPRPVRAQSAPGDLESTIKSPESQPARSRSAPALKYRSRPTKDKQASAREVAAPVTPDRGRKRGRDGDEEEDGGSPRKIHSTEGRRINRGRSL